MRKFVLVMLCLLATVGAKAQFENGKWFVNTYVTGLDLSYSKGDKGHFGFEGAVGHFLLDNLALIADVGADWSSPRDSYKLGAKARYYFSQTGIYLSGGLKLASVQYKHEKKQTDVAMLLETGYAYFVNRFITIEPAIYYDLSFKDSDWSRIGLKIGLGFYF